MKWKRDFSEEDRLKRELKELRGKLEDADLRKQKLEHMIDSKDIDINQLKSQIRDLVSPIFESNPIGERTL